MVDRMAEFAITTGQDSASVLAVSGDLDISGVDDFIDHADRLLESTPGTIDIDLGGVTFIDSSGLGALVRVQKSAHASGQRLRLAHVTRPVSRILDLTGLTDMFAEWPER
jgi:anti-anti-sigma factor